MKPSERGSQTACLPDRNAFAFPQLNFSYGRDAVLQIADLNIPAGQFVSVLGASGSGKSTLLRILAGLLPLTSNQLPLNQLKQRATQQRATQQRATQQRAIQQRSTQQRPSIGMVFQSPNLVPWRNAAGNVVLPAELGPDPRAVPTDRVAKLFQLVGLSDDDLTKRPAELSGGMQMRVAIARSLVLNPQTLLLDCLLYTSPSPRDRG